MHYTAPTVQQSMMEMAGECHIVLSRLCTRYSEKFWRGVQFGGSLETTTKPTKAFLPNLLNLLPYRIHC